MYQIVQRAHIASLGGGAGNTGYMRNLQLLRRVTAALAYTEMQGPQFLGRQSSRGIEMDAGSPSPSLSARTSFAMISLKLCPAGGDRPVTLGPAPGLSPPHPAHFFPLPLLADAEAIRSMSETPPFPADLPCLAPYDPAASPLEYPMGRAADVESDADCSSKMARRDEGPAGDAPGLSPAIVPPGDSSARPPRRMGMNLDWGLAAGPYAASGPSSRAFSDNRIADTRYGDSWREPGGEDPPAAAWPESG